ncbi:MAG: class I SAM-dependent methyltransferase [Candidatus Eremiobacteraeota bacterium]|nr:class I SAM-dependent methyltransferase [Candidatus Eremiobacteraeota bacterium]
MTRHSLAVSVVVVVHDMAREAPRTLHSLSPAYQRNIAADEYEIIVVDNGSAVPLDPAVVTGIASNARVIRIDPAPPSPASAINRGLAEARGDVVGVMIDGARLATPGLLHFARHAAALYDTAVVATMGWYLGHDLQGWSGPAGYTAAREDDLLASVGWPDDGYRLFEIGTMDESSVDGWFQPISESNALFLRRDAWERLGGVDERFTSPGGGLLNLDTFRRAIELPNAQLVLLLGEATFHQLHGGVSTNAFPTQQMRNWERWSAEYIAVRGRPYTVPERMPPAYVGTLPKPALARMVRAATHPAFAFSSPLGDHPDGAGSASEAPSDHSNGMASRLVALAVDEFRQGRGPASCGVARIARTLAPDQPDVLRILAATASDVTIDGPPPGKEIPYHLAAGEAHRIIGDEDAAVAHFRAALAHYSDIPQAHLALSQMRMPGEDYLTWLERIYATLRPATIVEIGVFEGASLARIRPPTIAIGIDPTPRVMYPLAAETHLFAETSDAFFANERARALLGDRPLSVGFIDGLHVFEQALRDFIGLEALCGPNSVIMLHDTVPFDEVTQMRERYTTFHTGDVWKVILCLKHYRPDLTISTIATWPSGLTIVTGLDPASRVLVDRYDEAVARFVDTPFSAVEADRTAALNIVANDWAVVEPLIAPYAHKGDSTPAPPPVTASLDVVPVGGFVVDRDQPPLSADDVHAIERFHELYYSRWLSTGADTINASWFGYQTLKCPLDLWLYQEILVRTRPDLVIETGTWSGGSALFLAMTLDRLGNGRVITIDTEPRPGRPVHPRIEYVTASSTDPQIAAHVHEAARGKRTLVILDSDHHAEHVYDELLAYSPLVAPGDYLIVEDTNVNGHPTFREFGPGPMEALQRFLAETDAFETDARCERFLMTLNPKGYLRRR